MKVLDGNHEEVQLKNEDEEVIDVRKRAQANRQENDEAQAKAPATPSEATTD